MDPQSSTNRNVDYYMSNIGSGAHGEEYQRDVALLMLERATRAKNDFKLAYEMSDAGKFDDVALYDENKKEWILIQTKHADTVNGPPKSIDWATLFPENNNEREKSDFSLFKYLRSYLEIQNRFSGSKKCYIFTNRTLNKAIQDNFLYCEAHQMLRMSNYEAKHFQLKSTNNIVNKLHDYINQDFETLIKAIIELFNGGHADSILNHYKSPLANVLSIRKGVLKFHEKFAANDPDSNTRCLYDSLQAKQIIGKERHNISKDITKVLTGQSRIKKLPLCVERTQVEDFIHNLVLSVGQPDNLRSIIERDIRVWIKTWIRPDDFGRLTETQVSLLATKFNDLCDFNRTTGENQKQMKKYFKVDDGESFFEKIKNELIQQIRNQSGQRWEEFERRYVNRQIVYTEQNGIDSEPEESGGTTNFKIDKQPLLKEAQVKITDREFANQMMNKFSKQQCLIFIAEPGMGKTTLLQFISFQVQQEDNCHVFLIYLNSVQKYLKEVKGISDLDKALNVLRDAISESNRNIIKVAATDGDGGMNSDRIVIFCDGFDEVHPKQAEQMIQVMKQLMSVKCVQIVISGRRHVKESLEKSFAVKSMRIVPLGFVDQVELFLKFRNVDANEATKCNSLVTSFLKHYEDINRSQCDSTGSPLIIRILGEVYSEQLIMKPDCDEDGSLLPPKTLDIVDLFEKFVRKCFYAKMSKKLNITINDDYSDDEYDSWYDTFILEHQSLAVMQLEIVDIQEYPKILADTYQTFKTRINKGSDKSLLVEYVEGKIQFTHLSFAEYFVAKLLIERVVKFSSKLHAVFEQNPGIRKFFFTMVEKWQATEESDHFMILNTHQNGENEAPTDNVMALYACEANCINLVKLLSKDHDLKSLKHNKMGSMLHVGVENNCTEICKFLITECGSEVDYVNENGKSLLFIASEWGYGDIAELLIDKCVAVNQLSLHHVTIIGDTFDKTEKQDKWAPLHIASFNGHVPVCQLLIGGGALIDIQQSDGLTPLYLATQNGHTDVVKLLIEKGALVNIQGQIGSAPIHMAASLGYADIVALFITEGASVDTQDQNEWTPIHFAAQNGHIHIVQLLSDHNAQVDGKTDNGITSLHMAAQNDHADVAKLLIGRKASVDAQKANKWTTLHMVAQYGFLDIVKLMIESNAKVDIKNDDGNIPLHVAAINGHTNVAFLLIECAPLTINIKNDDGQTPLHIAADKGHLKVTELLINNGAALDIRDKNEWTPLYFAVQNNHAKLAQLLLDYNAMVDVRTKNGTTPLHIAAFNGHFEVAKVMVEHQRPVVNIQNKAGATPLHLAVVKDHALVAKLLINHGALVDVQGPNDNTSLFIAAMYGYPELVELLSDHDSNTNIKNNEGMTPLYIAAQNGFTLIVEQLISKGAMVDIQKPNGWTPLQIACKNNRSDVVSLLIKSRALVNKTNNDGLSALHIAAAAGHIDVVELLIKSNALIYTKDKEGYTPLYYAVQEGHANIVHLLVKVGAKVNIRTKDGFTSLYIAALFDHVDVAKYLIEHGALVNIQHNTPLHIAAQNGHIDIVNLLIESEAMIEIKNEAGLTPLQFASLKGHVNIVKCLINKGALVYLQEPSGWTPLHMAAQNGHLDVVQHLIDSGARVDIMEKKRHTALYVAAENGKIEIVKLLIASGAAVNVKDKDGTTPLYIAARNGHGDVAKYLIEQGALVNIQDKLGVSPLDIAAQNGHGDVVKYLIEQGALVNIQGKLGVSLLDIAAANGHVDVVKLLITSDATTLDIQRKYSIRACLFAIKYGHLNFAKLLIEGNPSKDTQN
ncbi:uncharacterized protein LOC135712516 [Ochlerotatus camptorhynchus]|uniref:uncharacterized protein LOC135712516 n=1 Tax=Ochlerotatus camptorhynchus TaxID=644619 RepID=UPI0031DBA68A